MDWLSVDYCSEVREFVLNYIARERARVQQEINDVPEKITNRIRENGVKMQKLISALNPRINLLG